MTEDNTEQRHKQELAANNLRIYLATCANVAQGVLQNVIDKIPFDHPCTDEALILNKRLFELVQ